jgi:hypothetical protein
VVLGLHEHLAGLSAAAAASATVSLILPQTYTIVAPRFPGATVAAGRTEARKLLMQAGLPALPEAVADAQQEQQGVQTPVKQPVPAPAVPGWEGEGQHPAKAAPGWAQKWTEPVPPPTPGAIA